MPTAALVILAVVLLLVLLLAALHVVARARQRARDAEYRAQGFVPVPGHPGSYTKAQRLDLGPALSSAPRCRSQRPQVSREVRP